MVSGCPFLIQVTLVAGEPVEIQVTLEDMASRVTDMILGGTGEEHNIIYSYRYKHPPATTVAWTGCFVNEWECGGLGMR